MNKLNGIILLTGLTLSATAQQKNFLYIQTDNGQPFYVKKGAEVLSSSVHGHLVVSDLTDAEVEFRMGFPKGEVPEQAFAYRSGGKDQGVVLKNFGEKGWGLFNLQTLAVTYSGSVGTIKLGGNMVQEYGEAKTDTLPGNTGGKMARPGGFIDRLALVVDDPSIRIKPEIPVVKKEVVKQEVVKQTPPKADSAVVVKNTSLPDKVEAEKKAETVVKTNLGVENSVAVDSAQVVQSDKAQVKTQEKKEEKTEEIKGAPVLLKSNVVKKSMTKLDSGHMGIFIDEYSDGKRDTIKVFIPQDGLDAPVKEEVVPASDKKETVAFLDFSLKNGEGTGKNNTDSTVKIQVETDSASASGKDSVQALVDSVVAIVDTEITTDSAVNEIIDTAVVSVDSAIAVKSLGASETDMLQLRRKMAAETTEEDMVDVARKEFRRKKYAVAQIRHLAALFLKEEGRYAFLDAAYGNVTDKEQFSSLEDLLKETYYINRFKALVGK